MHQLRHGTSEWRPTPSTHQMTHPLLAWSISAAVRVILRVLQAFVLLLGEVKTLGLEGQAQLRKRKGCLPVDRSQSAFHWDSTH